MMRAYENHVRDVPGVSIGIVSPDGYEGMLQNAKEFAEGDIPFIFDHGQAMPLFNGEALSELLEQAAYVTDNAYEPHLPQTTEERRSGKASLSTCIYQWTHNHINT